MDTNENNVNKSIEETTDYIPTTVQTTPSRESVAQRIISWGAGADSPYRNTTAARLEREKELETVAQARIRSISSRENSSTDNDLVPGSNNNSNTNLPVCALCEKVVIQSWPTLQLYLLATLPPFLTLCTLLYCTVLYSTVTVIHPPRWCTVWRV